MKFTRPLWMLLLLALTTTLAPNRANAAPFDQQFIDSMVPHHQSALKMAQLAIKKAPHAQVRKLARGIVRDQKKEIAELKAWRKAWYGSSEVPMDMMKGDMMAMYNGVMTMPGNMMGLPMKMKMGKLQHLKGGAFEKMFLDMMVPHHASAISMAQEALDTTARPQLRKISHGIIDAQAKEIGEMHALHHRWYGPM